MPDHEFAGHVAVVTGGASGIGFGVALRFAEAGARVAILDRDDEAGTKAAAELERAGGVGLYLRTDVRLEEDVRSAMDRVANEFSALDHLVNNAGIVSVKKLEDCTVEEWDQVMDVNVKSIFLTAKYSLPLLKKSPHGTIVNIGSISSFIGQQGTPAYVASKGAVLTLSKALALDLATSGIRVNCVCPGITDTPMFRYHLRASGDEEGTLKRRLSRVPLRRALAPVEIGDTVVYLSSTRSSGVTGTSLVVDAGYTAAAEWSV